MGREHDGLDCVIVRVVIRGSPLPRGTVLTSLVVRVRAFREGDEGDTREDGLVKRRTRGRVAEEEAGHGAAQVRPDGLVPPDPKVPAGRLVRSVGPAEGSFEGVAVGPCADQRSTGATWGSGVSGRDAA